MLVTKDWISELKYNILTVLMLNNNDYYLHDYVVWM